MKIAAYIIGSIILLITGYSVYKNFSKEKESTNKGENKSDSEGNFTPRVPRTVQGSVPRSEQNTNARMIKKYKR